MLRLIYIEKISFKTSKLTSFKLLHCKW